jgi:hypothetical protein
MSESSNLMTSIGNSRPLQQKQNPPVYDSLRFSYDFNRISLLSEEGKDIDFEFEDYPYEV